MRFFADLEIHSPYARACSRNLTFENIIYYAKLKGLNLLNSGDFTHPARLRETKESLEETGSGFFKYKGSTDPIYFVLGTEISFIFSRKGSVKRVHCIIILPSLDLVEKLNQKLSLYAKLSSDGRLPIGMDIADFLKILLELYPKPIVIPAHIWTPWFSLYGSMSGFDSIYDAFGDLTDYVTAVETGLSSDPQMNWRLQELDKFSIVSFSDAHSAYPHRIGRETTVFDLAQPTYDNLYQALKQPDSQNRVVMTIEFFPEEGKYHFDGHRNCRISFSPAESKQQNYICPVCGRHITIGVMSRVEALATRPADYFDAQRPNYTKVIPLAEIIAEALASQPTSKKVIDIYTTLVREFGSEFEILLNNVDLDRLAKFVPPAVLLGLKKFKAGDLYIKPGYDGEYGVVRILKNDTLPTMTTQPSQKSLF